MGFITDFAGASKAVPWSPDRDREASMWRDVFGAPKVPDKPQTRAQSPTAGGSWGRSVSSKNALVRLLEALRSRAPGGWTDDRYEQTRSFQNIQYIAIHRCCEQMSQAEFRVSHKDPNHPDGKRPVTPDETTLEKNGPYDLVKLLEQPNPEDSFGDLMYWWNQQLDLTGMALTWMVPSQLGTPIELYPIPTSTAIPQPAISPDYPDGYYRIQPLYPFGPFSNYPTVNSAVGAPIPAQWMMRAKYPHPFLRYEGYSPLTAANLHLDGVEMIDRSRDASMRRTINPSASLDMSGMEEGEPLDGEEIDRIRAEFEQLLMGPDNAGQLFIPSPGTKLEPWGARPVDMDYQSGWEQLVSVSLAYFGITKPAAGMIETANYATLYAALKQLYWQTLDPKCWRLACRLTRILAPFFGNDLIVEVRCRPINDEEISFGKIDRGTTGKFITKNECRKLIDLPTTSEPWGEEMAGDASPVEREMASQEMETMAAAGMTGAEEGEDAEQDQEVEGTRPKPGPISAGALGPQAKSLSLYEQLRQGMRNGNGH